MRHIRIGLPLELKYVDKISIYKINYWYMRSLINATPQDVKLSIIKLTYEDDPELELDGILLAGGGKYSKERKGHVSLRKANPKRYMFEERLIKHALRNNIPMFGTCRGCQMINEVMGGKVAYISKLWGDYPIDHNSRKTRHSVNIMKDSILYEVLGKERVKTNSYHLKINSKLAPDLKATAFDNGGLLEAFEARNGHLIIGVQWHPELHKSMQPLFTYFLQKVAETS